MEREKIDAKIQAWVGHLQGVESKVLGTAGFWMWKSPGNNIWRLQHAASDLDLGRLVIKDGKAMVTPSTFTSPLPDNVKNQPDKESFCEDIVGIGYLKQAYLLDRLMEIQLATELRRLPDDKSLNNFMPEVVYKGIFCKATGRVYAEGTKLVLVKCNVAETGEVVDIRIPEVEAANLGLPEFKG
jgi:hypothetical protein